jgi:hypothetical protein
MNFIFTKFIHPIEKPIEISKKMKFKLDNPRTEEEIELVLSHLEKSLNSPDEVYEHEPQFRIPINLTEETQGILTVESALNDLHKNYSEHDSYLKSFFEINKDLKVLDRLARMWIIARFDDEGEHERLRESAKEMREEGHFGFFMLEKGNPIVDNCDNLVNYCYLLSLLFHSDDEFYHGQSFLLHHDSYELQFPKVDRFLNQSILYFGFMSYSTEINHEEDSWKSFFHIKEKLISASERLDEVIDDTNQEKILYVANLLKVIGHEIKDERYKLVTLVSIIELLLTHSPDYRRFNVEDSISKQFRLKTSILVYQNDKSKDLEWIKSRLKDIYNQRSNIAHGNFKSFKDYLKKAVKKSNEEDMSEEIILEQLSGDVYKFIRAIIEEYIKDRKMVEFLKEN